MVLPDGPRGGGGDQWAVVELVGHGGHDPDEGFVVRVGGRPGSDLVDADEVVSAVADGYAGCCSHLILLLSTCFQRTWLARSSSALAAVLEAHPGILLVLHEQLVYKEEVLSFSQRLLASTGVFGSPLDIVRHAAKGSPFPIWAMSAEHGRVVIEPVKAKTAAAAASAASAETLPSAAPPLPPTTLDAATRTVAYWLSVFSKHLASLAGRRDLGAAVVRNAQQRIALEQQLDAERGIGGPPVDGWQQQILLSADATICRVWFPEDVVVRHWSHFLTLLPASTSDEASMPRDLVMRSPLPLPLPFPPSPAVAADFLVRTALLATPFAPLSAVDVDGDGVFFGFLWDEAAVARLGCAPRDTNSPRR